MATFTSTANLDVKWNGLYFVGPAGTVHTFTDHRYAEFMDDIFPNIPGCVVTYPTDGGGAIQQVFQSNYITQILGGSDTSGNAQWVDGRFAIEILIDSGTSSVTAGFKGFVECPTTGQIIAGRILANGATTGTAVVDVWKDTYGNYPPTDADSITGGAELEITSGVKGQDTTLTGWNVDVTSGDIIGFNVDSITGGFTSLLVSLTLMRE
jgi:hypothetical protein